MFLKTRQVVANFVDGIRIDAIIVIDELLGHAAAKRHRELPLEVLLRVEPALHTVLRRREEREAAGAVRARDDGDLGHGVVVREPRCHNGVPGFVAGHERLPRHVFRAGLLGQPDRQTFFPLRLVS